MFIVRICIFKKSKWETTDKQYGWGSKRFNQCLPRGHWSNMWVSFIFFLMERQWLFTAYLYHGQGVFMYIYIASIYFYEKDIKNKHKTIIAIFIMKFPKKTFGDLAFRCSFFLSHLACLTQSVMWAFAISFSWHLSVCLLGIK